MRRPIASAKQRVQLLQRFLFVDLQPVGLRRCRNLDGVPEAGETGLAVLRHDQKLAGRQGV